MELLKTTYKWQSWADDYDPTESDFDAMDEEESANYWAYVKRIAMRSHPTSCAQRR